MENNNSFSKAGRLKSRKQIQELFLKGKNLYLHPIRVSYIIQRVETGRQASGTRAGVSVSKRYFKKAVDRNRIKRLLREVYRANNAGLLYTAGQQKISLSVFFIYVDKSLPTFALLQEKLPYCLLKLEEKIKAFK